MILYNYILVILLTCKVDIVVLKSKKTLKIFSVGTEVTDGYTLYLRSMKTYGLQLEGIFANGTDYSSHSVKVNTFIEELEKYKDENNTIILFTDSYDVLFTAGEEAIIKAFEAMNANIVFNAESNCSPSPELSRFYPKIKRGYRFLNSGGFIGYAPDVYNMLPLHLDKTMDDQLYYTLFFLDKTARASLNIVLDTQATIFQSLHEARDHVSLAFSENDATLVNHYTNTTPIIIHGNGFHGKILFQTFSSYLAKSWTPSRGCLSCAEERKSLSELSENEYPTVFTAVFIERQSPFLSEKLFRISSLSYPKNKMFLFVYNLIPIHEEVVQRWIKHHSKDYKDVLYVSYPKYDLAIGQVRNLAIQKCLNTSSDLYFSIDSEVYIENLDTLKLLISYNRNALAPIMVEPGTSRSTFWGSLSKDLKFAESFDYKNIINNTRRGIWSVPQFSHIYLIRRVNLHSELFHKFLAVLSDNPDVAISMMIRKSKFSSMFLYATNLEHYGYLSNMDYIPDDNYHGDIWQVASHYAVWEHKYLHPEFHNYLENKFLIEMICPDVFLFPVFSEKFCQEMTDRIDKSKIVKLKENKENITLSSNGFEKESSANITLNHIGYQKEWSFIIKRYLKPVAEKVFERYHSKGESMGSFLVRNSADEHYFPNYHLGFGAYSVNIALNREGGEYEGGMMKFTRYNCSMKGPPVGWATIHPGKLTHYHAVEPITKGTRYSLISFVDS